MIYQTARESIEGVLESIGLRQANERSLKKSAYCTTWVVSDGNGTIEDYDFCQNEHIWQPEITIYFHNGADREKLLATVNQTRFDIVTALIHFGKFNRPADLFQFGVPVEWETLEIEDTSATLKIKLTCIAQIED